MVAIVQDGKIQETEIVFPFAENETVVTSVAEFRTKWTTGEVFPLHEFESDSERLAVTQENVTDSFASSYQKASSVSNVRTNGQNVRW